MLSWCPIMSESAVSPDRAAEHGQHKIEIFSPENILGKRPRDWENILGKHRQRLPVFLCSSLDNATTKVQGWADLAFHLRKQLLLPLESRNSSFLPRRISKFL